jgi:hypothetical protein
MDFSLLSELRARRDDAFESARCRRLARLAASGRSTKVRDRIADSAQAMSDVLAALARGLRNGEAT